MPDEPGPSPPEEDIARERAADEALRSRSWVVIAAFREAKRIGPVVRELRACLPNVVVVDDGSDDDTQRIARSAGAIVLRHAINRGQGAALQTGFDYALSAQAEYIVTFDADAQHRPEDAWALVKHLASDPELGAVLGSRFLDLDPSMPGSRRMLLRAAVTFTRLTTGLRVTDAHNGLRALRRDVVQRFEVTMDRMAHASEIMDQIRDLRVKFEEHPVRIRYTAESLAKGQKTADAARVLFEYFVGRISK